MQEWGRPRVHPRHQLPRPRIGHIPGNYQVGFVVETFLASRILAYSDIFQKFPNLRICIAHAGGALDRFIASSRHRGNWEATTSSSTPAPTTSTTWSSPSSSGASPTSRSAPRPRLGRNVRQESDHPVPHRGRQDSDDLLPVLDYLPILSEEDKITIVNKNPLKVFPAFANVPE